MISPFEVIETIKMIQEEKLDIRTITLGISLLDCCHPDPGEACRKIYDKITGLASGLVRIGENIEREYGIPIINKRISVTPISLVAAASGAGHCVMFARALEKAADQVGVNFIGGFSALVHKGYTSGDRSLIQSIPEALSTTKKVCSSVNVATTKAGINMDAVREMGLIIKEAAGLTAGQGGLACAKLVVFANVPEDNPFMAGAFHGIGEPECVINVGVSGPGAIKSALEEVKGADFGVVAETIKKKAFKITRMGQLVAQEASRRLGVPFGIVDLSLAPTPSVGDSVAHILEEMGLEKCGAHGTTAARTVVHDHGLARMPGQRYAQRAGHDVHVAARSKGHDQRERLGGECARLHCRCSRCRSQRRERYRRADKASAARCDSIHFLCLLLFENQ